MVSCGCGGSFDTVLHLVDIGLSHPPWGCYRSVWYKQLHSDNPQLPIPLAAMHPPHLDISSSVLHCRNIAFWMAFLLTKIFIPGINSKVDSSEKSACPHCSSVQSFFSLAHGSLFLLYIAVWRSFLAAAQPDFNNLLTVLVDISTFMAPSKSPLIIFWCCF